MSHVLSQVAAGWVSLAQAVMDLSMPRGCAGCDRPDCILCQECRKSFYEFRARPAPEYSCGQAFACASYRGPVRRAILTWKDHDDAQVGKPLAQALQTLTSSVVQFFLAADRPVLVVPAPSSAASLRRRGGLQTLTLARAVAHTLEGKGLEASCAPVLLMSSVSSKSVQLQGSAARAQRVSGHIRLKPRLALGGQLALLVDDIITTGSTIRQCAQVLTQAGVEPVTACALAMAGK